ncbi:MAG: hypothetical protein M1813_008857 [Trichoglossum hirsutum]|nr:MAG: hypothetical protein M1813_008857 [Trichoglossum hirsutum]
MPPDFQYAPLQDLEEVGRTSQASRSLEKSIALIDGTWEIRLVRLLPSKLPSTSIECGLIHKTFKSVKWDEGLEGEQNESYEALSYVWGGDSAVMSDPVQRLCNISVNDYTFPVSQNLQAALCRLRDKVHVRYLWIDQICINQADIQERCRQVERMTLIYGYARRTIVWLGEEAHESYRAMLLLRGLARVAKQLSYTLETAVREFSDIPRWKALDMLFRRSWWRRTWVIQECAVSREISVVCGYRDIPWTDLVSAILLIKRLIDNKVMWQYIGRVDISLPIALHKSRLQTAARGIPRMEPAIPPARNEHSAGFNDLLEILSRYRTRQATDSRDKIYALLHLAKDFREAIFTSSPSLIRVDYGKAIEEVYQDVAEFFVSKTQCLNFLSHCRTSQRLSCLPSWVPDWSDTSETPYPLKPSIYSTAGSSTADAYVNGTKLTVKGIRFDHIVRLGSPCSAADFSQISPSPTFREWKELAMHESTTNTRGNDIRVGPNREEDYWRTLIADRTHNKRLNTDTLEQYREAYRIWDAFPPNESQDSISGARFADLYDTLCFVHALQQASLERRFYISAKGSMGLAPSGAEIGDTLAAFMGAQLPFVIRCRGLEEYRVVGECYVHSCVDGQLLGEQGPEKMEFEDITLI